MNEKTTKRVRMTIFYDLDESTSGAISGQLSDSIETDNKTRILELVSALMNGQKCPESEDDGICGLVPRSMTILTSKLTVSEWDRLSELVQGTSWDYTDVILDENGHVVRDENGKIIRKPKNE